MLPRLWCTAASIAIFHLPDGCADLIFTSPPYWPSPDYPVQSCTYEDGWHGRLGQEPEVRKYAKHLHYIFWQIRRLLKPEGLLWIVLGRHRHRGVCVDVPAEVVVQMVAGKADERWKWNLVDHLGWIKGQGPVDSILIFSRGPHAGGFSKTDGLYAGREFQPGPWTSFNPEMVEWAMNCTGQEKGLLLDPFCGVGTALLAAQKKGWDFIGVDPDQVQLQQAAKSLGVPLEEVRII